MPYGVAEEGVEGKSKVALSVASVNASAIARNGAEGQGRTGEPAECRALTAPAMQNAMQSAGGGAARRAPAGPAGRPLPLPTYLGAPGNRHRRQLPTYLRHATPPDYVV